MGRHFEISWKLCALLALESCAKVAQHHNKQKTTLHACTQHAKFAASLCRKVEVCRSRKVGRHFEISLKLCALLALESCAKVAQHHNKQKQLYLFVNTKLNLLQACAEKLRFAVVEKWVDTLKFHGNYVHYWL